MLEVSIVILGVYIIRFLPHRMFTMSQIKISELPLGVAENNAVVPATNAAGNQTNKIKLSDIVNLPHNHDNRYYTEAEIDSLLANKQQSGNYASLVNGLVPASQLPSYVDDVLEYASLNLFPTNGESGKIYVTLDSNKAYRWSGSAYIEIPSSPGSTDSVAEGSVNKYYTDQRASAAAPVQSVNGLTGNVTIDSANTGDIVFNNSTISTSDENADISINCGENTWSFNNNGNLNLPEGKTLSFGQNTDTLGPPVEGGGTDRVRLWDFNGGGTNYNYAIGAEPNHVWFAMDVNNGQGGFKFYSRDNEIFKISDDSKLMFPNGTTVAEGTFDNGTGGNGGISLNCVVGYELNWQGGRLKSTYNNGESTAPIFVDSPMSAPPVVLESVSYSNTINTDAKSGDMFDITLTENSTLANPTNPVNGQTLRWRITQDGTGNRTVTLGNKFNIPSSATSPLPWSTSANKMDVLAATYHAGRDKWDVVAFVPGY